MAVNRTGYETVLAEYSSPAGAIAALRQYRPYLEKVPSMRRPKDSVISIPLPLVRVKRMAEMGERSPETLRLPCDVAILMCDPEWKIKTGVEIFVFIHRPEEDFSDLLARWRQTQIWVDQGYEWLMPQRYQHILNDGAEEAFPLFVVFPHTPDRVRKGLKGAYLPTVVESVAEPSEEDLFDDPALPNWVQSPAGLGEGAEDRP
jgi:hypothetical protein